VLGDGEALEGVDERRGIADDRLPGNDSCEDKRDTDVEDGADDKRGDDADRNRTLRVAALFAGGGDGIEADVGEEDDAAAGEYACPSVGGEGRVVGGMDEVQANEHEGEDSDELDEHHDVVGAGRFADAADEDYGEDDNDEEGRDVEAEVPAGLIDEAAIQRLFAAGKKSGREPARTKVDAEPIEQIDKMRGEADADAHVGEGVFEDEIPADDPGDEFAHGGVGVGISRAGDGDHAGELGVAEASEGTDDGDEQHGECEGGTGAGPSAETGKIVMQQADDDVNDRRFNELVGGGRATDGRTDDREDARADNGADAERGERDGPEGLLEYRVRMLGVSDELVNRLGGKDLAGLAGGRQGAFPRQLDLPDCNDCKRILGKESGKAKEQRAELKLCPLKI